MPSHNADIAAIFEEIADLLEIEAANPFRIRAYRNAARMIGELSTEAYALLERGEDLTRIPGVGRDLAAKIEEIIRTGHCSLLDRLHTELPPAVAELLRVPGLGPKRVRHLYHDLDVQTIGQLYGAAHDGRIRALPGFGERTELHILQAVEAYANQIDRFTLAAAAQYAESLRSFLAAVPGVMAVTIAGSYRRMRETVGDLDIVVTAVSTSTVMQRFIQYDEVAETRALGSTRASVILRCGLQVDLRVVPEESYGAALHYFTGSKAHNIAVRHIAQKQGLKINEYGVYRGSMCIAGETEESVYQALGLPYIPPELRENTGVRSKWRAWEGFHNWSNQRTCAGICMPIPSRPTGTIPCAKWRWQPGPMAGNTSPLRTMPVDRIWPVASIQCALHANAPKSMP